MDWTAIWQNIDARIAREARKLRFAVRGVIQVVDATSKLPEIELEGLADERLSAELFQQFGFKSIPVPGAEVIVVQIGGPGGHYVAIASGDRSTAPSGLVPGDACLYSSTGAKVVVKSDGTVVMNDGTKGVARVDDPCGRSVAMGAWIDALTTYINGLTPGTLVLPIEPNYTITSGSTSVKAG